MKYRPVFPLVCSVNHKPWHFNWDKSTFDKSNNNFYCFFDDNRHIYFIH